MPSLVETLRARWRPEYTARLNGGAHAFETALSFLGAAANKRAELTKPGTLSEKGVAEALRKHIDQGIGAELTKFRAQVEQQRTALAERRAKLSKPTIDPGDVAAAVLRSEYRTYLRGLGNDGARLGLLASNPDPALAAAALESPALAGISNAILGHFLNAYIEKTAPAELKAIEETAEALDMVETAIQAAETDINTTITTPTRIAA